MNIIKTILGQYGGEITKGLSLNLGAGADSVEKSVKGALPAIVGGLINKAETKEGTSELFNLLSNKEYDGSSLSNIKNLFTGSAGSSLLKNGLNVLPMILGGQSKMGTVLNIAGRLFGGGLNQSQSIFGMLAPVVLSFLGKKLRADNLSKTGLADFLLSQKGSVSNAAAKEISEEMGFAKWGKFPSTETETDEDSTEIEMASTSNGGGLPKWLWPLLIIGSIAALFLLTKACGEIPEEKQKAMDAKAQQDERKANQQSQRAETKQQITKTPNNNTKPAPKANATAANQQKANAQKPVKPVQPTKQQPQKNTTPPNGNQVNNNAVQNNNTTTNKPNRVRKGIQNKPATAPKTTTTKPANVVKPTTAPKTNATTKPVTKPATNAANTATNTTRPGTKPATNAIGTKSKYRGSAALFDRAIQSKSGQAINFGTVSRDNKTLTPSAQSNFKQIAAIMKANPSTKISLRAHNPELKDAAKLNSAKQQGVVRANLLQKLLVSEGVQANRIKVESVGSTDPMIKQDPSNLRNQRISVKVN